jgi:hypothetical protein
VTPVIFYTDTVLAPDLWAHELVHVGQFRTLGVEAFAALYTHAWDAIEQDARVFEQFVARMLAKAAHLVNNITAPRPVGQSTNESRPLTINVPRWK